ncbi:hypothetical protein JMA_38560 (plasmid) [Jeotgalibacillus malaysiensis]|uniref:Uncharacterized protein n=1 Tax=Jeotgalibacillus malaysiensis TaxID=1508404 RepID=A0A0B5AYV4_9BACL|nr:hypothetical protein [Jeotgalibacillus malaysiensis]AJD93174.1 hypothetical protein JMA_38560 [Jeotgalibacillus malaysiensis]
MLMLTIYLVILLISVSIVYHYTHGYSKRIKVQKKVGLREDGFGYYDCVTEQRNFMCYTSTSIEFIVISFGFTLVINTLLMFLGFFTSSTQLAIAVPLSGITLLLVVQAVTCLTDDDIQAISSKKIPVKSLIQYSILEFEEEFHTQYGNHLLVIPLLQTEMDYKEDYYPKIESINRLLRTGKFDEKEVFDAIVSELVDLSFMLGSTTNFSFLSSKPMEEEIEIEILSVDDTSDKKVTVHGKTTYSNEYVAVVTGRFQKSIDEVQHYMGGFTESMLPELFDLYETTERLIQTYYTGRGENCEYFHVDGYEKWFAPDCFTESDWVGISPVIRENAIEWSEDPTVPGSHPTFRLIQLFYYNDKGVASETTIEALQAKAS